MSDKTYASMHVSLLDFAEALGVEFQMDWDGEVIIEHPTEISVDKLAAFLNKHGRKLSQEFRFREKRKQEVFVGGPFNGKRNDSYRTKGMHFGLKVSRARWAVYRQNGDGRAFFAGYATSEKKARMADMLILP